MTGLALAGCGAGGADAGNGEEVVEITLSGPNQWNNNPSSFGPAWEDMVARFEEAEPNIKVKTTVLPIPTFAQTLSTQLTAGTAPELVFNQAPHSPDQVVNLDEYMAAPSPYSDADTWLDSFDQKYFGTGNAGSKNAAGNYEWAPLNLVIIGVYYNEEIFEEAGVTAPIETMDDMMDACVAIKDAGYTPFAMDNGWLGQGWTLSTIESMLVDKYADELNQFAPDGSPGTSPQVSGKSISKAVLTGELSPLETPEIAESLKITKDFFDACATPNWSGIQGGAAFIGNDEWLSGKAAMSYGTNFAANNLEDVDWAYGTMPFPTITDETTSLSDNTPARFGAAPGGTSYMIPATTEGAKLEAAVKFLQFVTSAEGNQEWMNNSGGIPATVDGEPAPGLEGLMSGEWFNSPTIPALTLTPKAKAGQALYTGYLLGDKSLEDQLVEMQEDWTQASQEQAADGGWTEDWAQ
ncbi:sugar ABC transporter substrate-binding protein [Microbacterium awajiense]|uniref:Sugar ABC transporter substrate-binding protein n=1 Tax=Microbacterium awajiense TaxID=415214 RepID=A0ABP7AT73_9MICO